jgi:hypothetical protein
MSDYSAGEAKLRIFLDAKNFKRDLDAELKSQQTEFMVQVRADAARAREELDRMRAEQ